MAKQFTPKLADNILVNVQDFQTPTIMVMYVLTSLAEAISGTLAVSSYLLFHTALPDLAKADGYHLLYNAI